MLFTARIVHTRGVRHCEGGVTANVSVIEWAGARVVYASAVCQPVIFNPDTSKSSIYSLGNQRGDTR